MRKLLLVLLILCVGLFGFEYDPQDGSGTLDEEILAGWRIYDNAPSGSTITPYIQQSSVTTPSGVILKGDGIKNGFVLENPDGSNWNEHNHNVIKWEFDHSTWTLDEGYTPYDRNTIFYVTVKLTDGTTRYLAYTLNAQGRYGNVLEFKYSTGPSPYYPSNFFRIPLYVIRNLTKDLHRYEPDKEIDYIVDFAVRSNNVRIYSVTSYNVIASSVMLFRYLGSSYDSMSYQYHQEDGKAVSRIALAGKWRVYDNTPEGASLEITQEGAILKSNGIQNGFVYENKDSIDWNLVEYNYVKFEGAFPQSDAIIYLTVKLDDGSTKYLSYVTDKAMADYGSYGNVLVSYLPKSEDGNISTVFDIQKTLHDNGITDYGRVLVDVAVRGSGTVTHISAHDSLENLK